MPWGQWQVSVLLEVAIGGHGQGQAAVPTRTGRVTSGAAKCSMRLSWWWGRRRLRLTRCWCSGIHHLLRKENPLMQKYQGKLWSSHLVCLCVCFLVIIALFILTSCGSTSGKTSNPVPSPKSSPITSGERVIVYTDGEFGRTVLARRANDGTPLWHFQSGKSISTSVSDPVVVNHGVVYIAMAATSYTGSMTSMGDWLYAVRMS